MTMDAVLCDELMMEIFQRLPPPSAAAVSLVSKRWLRLFRAATSALSISFLHAPPIFPSFSAFLSHHPYLSSLCIISTFSAVSADLLLLAVAESCRNLRRLSLSTDPVTASSLLSLSSCPQLSSLSISICRPLCFRWLPPLRRLKHLSLFVAGQMVPEFAEDDETPKSELNLESLCLSGAQSADYWLNYLWENCREIRKLELRGCEGVGDNSGFTDFLKSLNSLQCVELRRCRSIIEWILLKLGQHSVSLNSLLIYDGGNREGLLRFIRDGRCCNIQTLDLRLPLDLDNSHLLAISEKFKCLSVLRLQGCYLPTIAGLQAIAQGSSSECIEELALINCHVVERESGLLTFLGQNLKRLRKLDLSYNEMLVDKELTSMLVSCNRLRELKLRGCSSVTSWVMIAIAIRKNCRCLEVVDVMHCRMISSTAVEFFIENFSSLRLLQVEDHKVSDNAGVLASQKGVEIVDD